MSDVRFEYNPEILDFDIDIRRWEIEYDDGLETAVLTSLFSNRRVEASELQRGEVERGGWWGDAVANENRSLTGSRLWRIIDRGKATAEALEEVREACLEALQWLIDDMIAESVVVETSYLNRETMLIQIEIVKPSGENESFQFSFVWEGRQNGI